MSYSRWSNSFWYTFWLATPEDTPMEDQQFSIDCENHFSYKNLKNDMDMCINNIRKYYEEGEFSRLPSEEEYEELRGYMQEFVRDIEEEYLNKG
jgi:hypothetical protein